MKTKQKFIFTSTPENSGQRLDQFLHNELSVHSRNQIQKWIKQGAVLLNGQPNSPAYSIKLQDKISLEIPPESISILPDDIDLKVLYEDSSLLIINKPEGLITHPTAHQKRGTLVNAVAHYLQNRREKTPFTGERLGLVHRLDKDTSGLIILAKTTRALAALARQFKEREIQKTYRAVVIGNIKSRKGRIEGSIGKKVGSFKMDVISGGKESQTDFKLLEQYSGHSYLEIYPRTGRTHQIRVHFAKIGLPVLGDRTYGPDPEPQTRMMLHAYKIKFIHPIQKNPVECMAPLPRSFNQVLHELPE